MNRAPRRVVVVVNLALLAAIGYLASSVLSTAIALRLTATPSVDLRTLPPELTRPAREPPSHYDVISTRDIFTSAKPELAARAEPPRESVLRARLWGVALRGDGDSSCVIEDLDAQQQALFKIGDRVQGDATIARIEWERVVLVRNGEEETIELTPERRLAGMAGAAEASVARLSRTHVQKTGDHQFVIDRGEFEQVLAVSMAQMASQMRPEPVMEDGQITGYRLSDVRPGGLFSQLGFQSGDIVRRINGNEFASGMPGFPDVHTVPELTVGVWRNGTMQTLRYRFR
jgi:general secretion pathway protein C